MQYLLMIYAAEDSGPQSPEEESAQMEGYMAFTQEVSEAGVLVGGEPLQPVSTATTVRVRDGQSITTDGPFAETKEVLGGYYLLDCDNLDQALGYAAKIPTAAYGSIEVRPLMQIPGRD